MTETPRNPDIILVWPHGREVRVSAPVAGCSVRTLPPSLDAGPTVDGCLAG